MQRFCLLAAAISVGLATSASAGSHHLYVDSCVPSCAAPACTVCEQAMNACGCMVCGTGVCGCPSAVMPMCSVCDNGMTCWECCFQEAIDVDSLTPQAQSRDLYDSYLARIDVVLPEDGTVYLLTQMMTTPGERRSYTVPFQNRDKAYDYDVKFEFVMDGQKYFKKWTINEFRAGSIVKLVVAPNPGSDDTPPEILVEPEVLAAGGEGNPPEAEPAVDSAAAYDG
jgi:hypothetical protein